MADQEYPAINGQKHMWADVIIKAAGADRRGFTSLNYKVKRAVKDLHGTGPNRVGVGLGAVTYEVDAEMYREHYQELIDALGDGYTSVPFQIVVAYRTRVGARLIRDTLNGARLVEGGVSGSEGEDAIKVKLTLNVGEILFNGKRAA